MVNFMKGSGEAFDLLAESAGESESSTSPENRERRRGSSGGRGCYQLVDAGLGLLSSTSFGVQDVRLKSCLGYTRQ